MTTALAAAAPPRHLQVMVHAPAPPIPQPPSRLATVAIWTLSLGALAVGGVLASLFVMMPVSLDLGEMVAAGADPWRDAAYAAVGFCLLFVAGVAALVLWHRSRGRGAAGLVAWAITVGEVAAVAYGGAAVIHDWF